MSFLLAILFFLLLLVPPQTTAQNCSVAYCSQSLFPIRFPFRAQGRQPQSCAFPGFNLSCSTLGKTVLKLPSSGEFLVRSIDYVTQQIRIYDPDNCLPRRLLKWDLWGSPVFSAAFYQNYTFLSCPFNISSSSSTVHCLSNATTTVVASTDKSYVSIMSTVCDTLATLPIPVSWAVYGSEGPASELDQDLELYWYTPNCRHCEMNGGFCGFESNISREIGCFYDPKQRRRGLLIFRIICLSIALPAVLCAIGIGCFLCFTNRRAGRPGSYRPRQGTNGATAVTPQPATIPVGLDESTIQSFTKVVLGESMRVIGPNNDVCPICLADYLPKEILRCIPECQHCFHADCVDEWLRMNTSCPVCRNSPSPTRAATENP